MMACACADVRQIKKRMSFAMIFFMVMFF